MTDSGMVGWDFSRLAERMWAAEPPWDFEAMCSAAMSDARRVLDLGTGGGEQLVRLLESLPEPRPQLLATEAWAPNLPVAASNLRPFGVDVVAYDAEADPADAARLPEGEITLTQRMFWLRADRRAT